MARGRFGRRAALRGALGALVAWTATVPARLRPARPAAVLAATAVGAAQELPAAGVIVSGAGVLALRGRGRGRASAAGVGIGAVAAVATRRAWPVAPRSPAAIRGAVTPLVGEPTDDGEGLTFVVNLGAGPALSSNPADELRAAFPRAEVLEVGDDLDLDAALERAAAGAKAIGIAGGDGSVGAAAAIAHRAGKPLAVIPAGTLNHLARDLGIDSIADAIAAVRHGDLAAVDVGMIDGRPFLNTASFGAYSELVDAREQLESAFGKWPALVVALARLLHRQRPVDVEIDSRRRRLWMIFVGNCRYHPDGFAPSWRERLDDGVLDVRLVDAGVRFARARLLLAVLTGSLARTPAYEERTVTALSVRMLGSRQPRLASDGETFDGSREFVICKADRPLALYARRNDRPT